MINEPLPHQLTVGRLKEQLRGIPDATVVGLVVPPSLYMEPRLTLIDNVRIRYDDGAMLRIIPVETTSGPTS